MTDNKKTLLIIGNGFDLSLGMNSTFKEFGRRRRVKLNSTPVTEWTVFDLMIEADVRGNKWDQNYLAASWHDFELMLKERLISALNNRDFLGIVDSWENYQESMEDNETKYRVLNENTKSIATTLSRDNYILKHKYYPNISGYYIDDDLLQSVVPSNGIDFYICVLLLTRRLNKSYSENLNLFYQIDDISKDKYEQITNENISDSDIYSLEDAFWISLYKLTPLLIDDLRIWEKAFSEFIANEIAKDEIYSLDYYTAAEKLITSILKDGEFKESKQDVQILNFNYSVPKINQSENLFFRDTLNIHGSINNTAFLKSRLSGIVMGFDFNTIFNKDIFHPELLAPFTKTFRISELNTILSEKQREFHPVKLDYNVDRIIIIGHSLSEADDSYYRTIFDTANLYDGDVILEYWYTDYFERDQRLPIETDNLQTVNNLLSRYIKNTNISGVTNKNNLLHKLLLENRLVLRRYNVEDILKS